MNFTIARPQAFYFILLLIFALVYVIKRYSRIKKTFSEKNGVRNQVYAFRRFKVCFISRSIFRTLAALCVIFAFAGISWGTKIIPVQKNGKAVSFVFDISYSMETKDAPERTTRLQAAANYVQQLLEYMDGVRISIVLAKGDGVIALPLTEDYPAIKTLLNNLSPKLMTAQGSSLGKGIRCAINSFPSQTSESSFIWLFTDGEETDGNLVLSIEEAAASGIPVAIIGFGSERESEVLAGDGVTKVKTALRSAEILKVIEQVEKIKNINHSTKNPIVTYVDASEMGSAWKLLKALSLTNSELEISYESQPIERNTLFIILALVFYMFSFIFGEADLIQGKHTLFSKFSSLSIVLLLFSSCGLKTREGKQILEGSLNWSKKNYQEAIANFMNVEILSEKENDKMANDYALCNLATTYIMQNENDAALEKFDQISKDAPENIKFAIYYNSGIIAHRRGDYEAAAKLFKEALFIDSSNIDAKVNYELSLLGKNIQEKQLEKQLEPVIETNNNTSFEKELYSVIKETESKQWKNKQQESEKSSLDY